MTGPTADRSAPAVPAEEQELLGALRRGDEAAFARLVETLHGSMLRLAMIHLGDRAVAEEVVQDAWVGVLQQLDRFEGRSSLRTWVLRIVSNRAKTGGRPCPRWSGPWPPCRAEPAAPGGDPPGAR
jgi:RNA polymerase sigma-70 factor, ECF subfamily